MSDVLGGAEPRVASVDPTPSIDLDALYRDEAPRLLRYFGRRSGYQNALDLFHDAFASLASAARRETAPIERPGAYLGRVAANAVHRNRRTAARRSEDCHVSAELVDLAGPDPLAVLEARDVLQRLEAVLGRLRPITREIFLARRLDGYSYREIADRTGLSVKRVEKHMAKALATIAEATAQW